MSNTLKQTILPFLLFIQSGLTTSAQVTIKDSRHYSSVFGEMRNFRIFLPPGYNSHSDKKYPVIYFLHGWGQRYFGPGEDSYAAFDNNDDNNGDNIEKFVSTHDVIVVKSDGYNHDVNESYYKRPYNVGPVETYRQFPIYFEELIKFIDSKYKTKNDRGHRGITGLSMGGFMAYVIGGKYPQLFSAIGSFCPSAEFLIGPKDFPAEYNHIFMYKNYDGANLYLNYGDKDFIRTYHEDRNKIWSQVLDNYSSRMYPGEHSTVGLGDMLDSFIKTFEKPTQRPVKWSHIDIYPDFSVWDYMVTSDRDLPGYTILENVDEHGFKSTIREFLPGGEVLPLTNLAVLTPAMYEKNSKYIINDYDAIQKTASRKDIVSDKDGRLSISINGSQHYVGINKPTDKPNLTMLSYKIENMDWAKEKTDIALTVNLLNKGQSVARQVKATISTTNSGVQIIKKETTIGNIAVNESLASKTPLVFHITGDSIEIVKFKLSLEDNNMMKWEEFFEIEIIPDLTEFKDFVIADGKIFTVASSGIETDTVHLGTGNGDGVANPGESIVLLAKDQGKYWRTSLQTAGKFVNPFGINIQNSESWVNFDHVGGTAKYSIPLISSECPEGTAINFIATYWIPGPGVTHKIKRGKINVAITGRDIVPPVLRSVQVQGDNVLQARIIDGSKISTVKAVIISEKDPGKRIEVELNDDGRNGDRVAGDNFYSNTIPLNKMGFYRIQIEATDSYGNSNVSEAKGTFVLH